MDDALLVLRLSALGDIIHTLPAVHALRETFPGRPIGWLVEAPYREFTELVAPVDRVFTAATKRWRRSTNKRDVLREVRGVRSDLREFAAHGTSIDFQGLVKSALFGRLAGARHRYGFGRRSIREKLAVMWINRRVEVDRSRHVIEWNLELAAAAGARIDSPPRFGFERLPEDPDGSLQQLIADHPVVLNPGAGQARKFWGTDRFAHLARIISTERGVRPLVVWGPGEEHMASAIAAESPAVVAPPTSLRRLAFLLSRARVVVASDTGPLHLAAALGTPVVGLFGPTDPRRNGPWGQIERCVESFSADRQMSSIAVQDVARQVLESV